MPNGEMVEADIMSDDAQKALAPPPPVDKAAAPPAKPEDADGDEDGDEEDEEGDVAAGGEGGDGAAAKKKRKKKNKKKKKAAGAGEGEAGAAAPGAAPAAAAKAVAHPTVQTEPPSVPVRLLFPSGSFPEGEWQSYKDDNLWRETAAEKREQERLQWDMINQVGRGAWRVPRCVCVLLGGGRVQQHAAPC
jgi:methionyl aminopeptidase